VDVDLDQYRFDWDQFPDAITANTPQADVKQLARYSFATAAVVRKDFGTSGYKRLLNSVDDLEAHFAVDAEIYVHLADKLPLSPTDLTAKLRAERITNLIDQAQIITLLTTELAAGRPVYFHFGNIKDFGHSTVIDGIRKEGERHRVHINFGAKEAEQNKWYELFAPISQPDDETLRAFVTIKPRPSREDGKQVSTDVSTGTQLEKLLHEKLPHLLAQHHVPAAAVAVIRDGELVATAVVGEQESGKLATKSTLFNVASLTKPVFAHAILALVAKGRFSLDEPLAPYWVDPDLKDDARHPALTARHVLSHQTGFPNWRDGKKLRFNFKPGEGVGYSGEGFDYLRRALEAKTRRSMTQIVSETVFAPFGMSDTHFVWNATFEGRFAREHDKEGQRVEVPPKTAPSAADDLITTIGDYGRFAAAVARGANLPSALFNEMCSIQIPERVAAKAEGPADYGLCWRVVTTPHGTALMHGGSDRGVRAAVIVVPKAQAGVVILTNGDNGGHIIEAVVPLVLQNGNDYLAQYIGQAAARK
jgi:CubicO group peptidase (beta-lactamase class C family)